MNLIFRTYQGTLSYDGDYNAVFQFLVDLNAHQLLSPDFTWTRWEWMFARAPFNDDHLKTIGLWFDKDKLVGVVTPEDTPGEFFLLCLPEYTLLYPFMLMYVEKQIKDGKKVKILIPNDNLILKELAIKQGFLATPNQDTNMWIDLTNLPPLIDLKDFSYGSLEHPDYRQLNRLLWRGFNHQGEPSMDDVTIEERHHMFSSPHTNPSFFISIKTLTDEYVSFAGSWYIPGTDIGFLEPVATDPSYRSMGLGKAAVYRSLLECKNTGATHVLVGSGQSFYKKIGFTIYNQSTWWEK